MLMMVPSFLADLSSYFSVLWVPRLYAVTRKVEKVEHDAIQKQTEHIENSTIIVINTKGHLAYTPKPNRKKNALKPMSAFT